MSTKDKNTDIALVPFESLKAGIKIALKSSKTDSDKVLAKMQADNAQRRVVKKKP